MDSAAALRAQWANPSDITAILMIIGGDVVQTALAQSTGAWFVPVCFSFGWVAYSFMALVNVLGDGRLMPPPDFPVKVFNLDSGYARENKNWVIGRLMRDHEAAISRKYPLRGKGFRVTVYEAQKPQAGLRRYLLTRIQVIGLILIGVQFVVAAIPLARHGDWVIMVVTGAGTALSLLFGTLPQWTVEKRPYRTESRATYGLTSGNGSRDVLVIKGLGHCLHLEEFATPDSPRNGQAWQRLPRMPGWTMDSERHLGGKHHDREKYPAGRGQVQRSNSVFRRTQEVCGFSVGFWITIVACVAESILWLSLLVMVAAVKVNTWYLLAVGALGMFQNAIMAAMEMKSDHRGLPLKEVDFIITEKVMDGIMDLETTHGCGRSLVEEFFPGKRTDDEEAWWSGDRDAYDNKRKAQSFKRAPPRRPTTRVLGKPSNPEASS